jgi:uncharacterized protein
MRHERFGDHDVLRLEIGEEVMEVLLHYAALQGVEAAYFVAFGALERVELAYYNVVSKQYETNVVDRQVEVVSLLGNVAIGDKGPVVHAHVAVSDEQGSTCSGHLVRGIVRSTLEVFITRLPGKLRRAHDPETGLNLLDLA